jgi:uncharacterized protein (TIGR03435 family)
MMKLLVAVTILPAALSFGQSLPAFEVASIKPSTADPISGSGITSEKGRISARNVTLKRCVRGAYDVPESLVFGGPKWVDDERYDIEAKAVGPAGDHDLMVMLQSLLTERFKLAMHRETRTLPGYALVVGKNGLTAKRSEPDSPSRTNSSSSASRKTINAQACNMVGLAQKLAEALHAPVADLTAVEGEYDFKLEWTPDDMKPGAAAALPAGPSIFTALQEQLGLKLEPRKVPTEVLVIDRAEKASAN